ncbi:MAG: NADH-quinone oxidoreductase subunit NuoE [Phycisphaerae bacterium]
MAWIVEDRLKPYQPVRSEPYLTAEIRSDIEQKYFPRYPRKQAALLPLFHTIMHTYGYIAPQAIDEAAEFLGITRAQVQDAVTFYEEFRLQPSGKYVVNVCRSISCELCGHQAVLDKIRDVFGIEPGETTEDGKFTLLEVECLGACEQAPCALVNEDLHGRLEPDKFAAQLRALPDHPEAEH